MDVLSLQPLVSEHYYVKNSFGEVECLCFQGIILFSSVNVSLSMKFIDTKISFEKGYICELYCYLLFLKSTLNDISLPIQFVFP